MLILELKRSVTGESNSMSTSTALLNVGLWVGMELKSNISSAMVIPPK